MPRASEFDAVFYPGGHGPMFDLADDKDSIAIAADVFSRGKPVAAVCHGPASILNIKSPAGESILKGRKVTGFSDSEEDAVKLTEVMPFSLEKRLGEKSEGGFEKAQDWGEKVIVDGQVITGQNPASAKGVGEALAKALSELPACVCVCVLEGRLLTFARHLSSGCFLSRGTGRV